MKAIAHASLAALICMVFVQGVKGQQMSDEHKAELEKLAIFIGEWEASGAVMEGDGSRLETDMTMNVVKIVEGWALELNFIGEIAEVGTYAEKELLAYDPGSRLVTMFTMSNWGEVGMYTGGWDPEQENTLVLTGSRKIGDETVYIEAHFIFKDDDTLDWRWYAKKDGAVVGSFTALFEK